LFSDPRIWTVFYSTWGVTNSEEIAAEEYSALFPLYENLSLPMRDFRFDTCKRRQ
jgi:hypothetical protein